MKIFIKKMGCKVNEYEAMSIATALKQSGHTIVNIIEECDVAIIFTCAVTSMAEKKSRQMVGHIHQKNNEAKIIVCGCSTQSSPNDYLKKDNILAVLGANHKTKILEIIESVAKNENSEKNMIYEAPEEYENYVVPETEKTRHFIKIQDGCNNFCSYCLIPYLRGRNRAREVQDIVNEMEQIKNNVQEIVISGINITAFKANTGENLTDLLKLFTNYKNRIRLSSFECNIVDDNFLLALSQIENFCPHFHLSLQTGCDNILKDMNRHYTTEQFYNSVCKIREYFPDCAITTDIIVGYPTETDEDFEETLEFIKKVNFADIHCFKFSPRPNTIASTLKQLHGDILNERQQKLLELKHKLHFDYITQNLDKTHSVLIEQKKNGYYIGYTKKYIMTYIKANQLTINEIVNIKLVGVYKDGALGEIAG